MDVPVPSGTHAMMVIVGMMALSSACAAGACERQVAVAVRDAHSQVAELRRGTPVDLQWLRQQLQMIDSACERGGEVEAAWRVEAVLRRLQRRAGTRARRIQPVPFTGEALMRRGSRIVKADPFPSRLSTLMLPP